jgi:hypothetical protein
MGLLADQAGTHTHECGGHETQPCTRHPRSRWHLAQHCREGAAAAAAHEHVAHRDGKLLLLLLLLLLVPRRAFIVSAAAVGVMIVCEVCTEEGALPRSPLGVTLQCSTNSHQPTTP